MIETKSSSFTNFDKMAFGGSLNTDFLSDETFDLLCTMCKRKGINREAEKYCEECNDNYCLVCVKVHEDVPSLTGHKILDQAQKLASSKQKSSQSQLAAPTDRCDSHTHYYIDTYCQNHDEVGCATCMSVDHRSCKQIFYIPEFLKNNPSTPPKQVQHNLDGASRILSEVHEGLQCNKQHLLKGKAESLGKVRKFRKEINDRLDELEKNSVDEIESIYKALINEIDDALGRVQTTKSNVTSARSKVASPANNVSQAFVDSKKGKQIANNATKCAEDSKVQIHAEEFDFTTHQKLSDELKEVNALGVISQRNIKVTGRSDTGTAYRQNNLSHKSSEKKYFGSAQEKDSLHRVTGKITYSVRVKSDKDDCDIVCACTVDDGTIILSDYKNKKLKRLDSSILTVKDCCDLPGKPWQVCPISKQEVAVSLISKQVVQLISVGASLRKTKQINTDFCCWGVAYSNGNLYISDLTSVFIYNVSSSKLSQFSKNQPEQSLFSDIRSLAVSKDGSKIYVSDCESGLTALDNNGQVVEQYNGQKLYGAFNCFLTATGSLLVCGYHSHNILQFGPDGELVGQVVRSDENKLYQAVCCNQQMSKVIVGSYSDNNIEVYDLV